MRMLSEIPSRSDPELAHELVHYGPEIQHTGQKITSKPEQWGKSSNYSKNGANL